jgi:hypothetical protein
MVNEVPPDHGVHSDAAAAAPLLMRTTIASLPPFKKNCCMA